MKALFFFGFFCCAHFVVEAQNFSNSVVYFLDPECKLSQSKALDIKKTVDKYHHQLDFHFVFLKQVNKRKMKAFINMFADTKKFFSSKVDIDDKLAMKFKANTVPSVFLINKQASVLYSGALDDKDVSIVKSKNSSYTKLIDKAIAQYLEGEAISVPYQKPIGCVFR